MPIKGKGHDHPGRPRDLSAHRAELENNKAITQSGICPDCGSPLEYSLGNRYVQCVAYPVPSRRKSEFSKLPGCRFRVQVSD